MRSDSIRAAYYKGAKEALKIASSLLKANLPGAGLAIAYVIQEYIVSRKVDIVLPFLLYIAITTVLQPIVLFYKIVEFIGEAHALRSSEERLGYIKTKCVNLEVVRYYDIGNTRYIVVRCRLGYMTRHGCPWNCPGYRSYTPTGAATFVGTVLGGLIGLAGGPLGVLAGAILGGLLGMAYEAGSLTPFERLVNEARSRGLRIVVEISEA